MQGCLSKNTKARTTGGGRPYDCLRYCLCWGMQPSAPGRPYDCLRYCPCRDGRPGRPRPVVPTTT